MSPKVKYFLPFAVLITLLSGLIYGTGQQILRQSANDPQIQFAEDIASSLSAGNSPQAVIPPARMDMSKSLATFIMVFNNKGGLTLSTGEINGKVPTVPSGVFSYVNKNGEDRLTWQPQTGVRTAAVVTKYKNGYVLVGRSLRETEKRIDNLMKIVALGWIVTLAATFASILFLSPKKK